MSLSALESSSTRKFMMLGLLTLTKFFDENIFSGYIFRKEFNLFSKMVKATNCPFSVSPSSVTRKMVQPNPALIDLSGKSASNISEPTRRHKIRNSPKTLILLRNCINICYEYLDLPNNSLTISLSLILDQISIDSVQLEGRGCRRACMLVLLSHGMHQCNLCFDFINMSEYSEVLAL